MYINKHAFPIVSYQLSSLPISFCYSSVTQMIVLIWKSKQNTHCLSNNETQLKEDANLLLSLLKYVYINKEKNVLLCLLYFGHHIIFESYTKNGGMVVWNAHMVWRCWWYGSKSPLGWLFDINLECSGFHSSELNIYQFL